MIVRLVMNPNTIVSRSSIFEILISLQLQGFTLFVGILIPCNSYGVKSINFFDLLCLYMLVL